MRQVLVVIGPGQIGQAIGRRVGIGEHVPLADMRAEGASSAAEAMGGRGVRREHRDGRRLVA